MKHFSTFVIAFCLLVVSVYVQAQSYSLESGEENSIKYPKRNGDYALVDKAPSDGHYYVTIPEKNAVGNLTGIFVEEVDINYNVVHSVEVPNAWEYRPCYMQFAGQRLHVVIRGSFREYFAMRYICIDTSSFEIVVDSMLVKLPLSKNYVSLDWYAQSPSKNYFGMAYAKVNKRTQSAEGNVCMFDQEMRQIWMQPIQATSISQVFTTDDGRLATIGVHFGKNKRENDQLEFTLTDADATKRYVCPVNYPIARINILNVKGNQLIASCLNVKKGLGWGNLLQRHKDKFTGVSSFLFDFNSGQIKNSSSYAFTKSDARAFKNKNAFISPLISPKVDRISLRVKAATPQGGAALYGRMWQEYIRHDGMRSITDYYKGLMLVCVDTNGNIAYTRTIPHDNSLNGERGDGDGETDMVVVSDKVYVLTNESKRERDTYEPTKTARKHLLSLHSTISAYCFDADGNVEKSKVITDRKSVIRNKMRQQTDGVFTLLTSGYKFDCSISELTITP